ncbi:unnamed protein product, partial [Oppiella nova]
MSELSLNQSWDYLSASLTHFEPTRGHNSRELQTAIQVLKDNSFLEILIEWYYDLYNTYINEELVPQFWSPFKTRHHSASADSSDTPFPTTSTHDILFAAFNELFVSANKWIENQVLRSVFELCSDCQ